MFEPTTVLNKRRRRKMINYGWNIFTADKSSTLKICQISSLLPVFVYDLCLCCFSFLLAGGRKKLSDNDDYFLIPKNINKKKRREEETNHQTSQVGS